MQNSDREGLGRRVAILTGAVASIVAIIGIFLCVSTYIVRSRRRRARVAASERRTSTRSNHLMPRPKSELSYEDSSSPVVPFEDDDGSTDLSGTQRFSVLSIDISGAPRRSMEVRNLEGVEMEDARDPSRPSSD